MKVVSHTLPVLAGILLASIPAFAQFDRAGAIYTITNESNNELVVYDRAEFGTLTKHKSYSTGGAELAALSAPTMLSRFRKTGAGW